MKDQKKLSWSHQIYISLYYAMLAAGVIFFVVGIISFVPGYLAIGVYQRQHETLNLVWKICQSIFFISFFIAQIVAAYRALKNQTRAAWWYGMCLSIIIFFGCICFAFISPSAWEKTDVVWTKDDTLFVIGWAYILIAFPSIIGGTIATCRHALMSKK